MAVDWVKNYNKGGAGTASRFKAAYHACIK